jgi:hypothetical protein
MADSIGFARTCCDAGGERFTNHPIRLTIVVSAVAVLILSASIPAFGDFLSHTCLMIFAVLLLFGDYICSVFSETLVALGPIGIILLAIYFRLGKLLRNDARK